MRAALGWSLSVVGTGLGLGLAAALGSFWHTRGHLSEGRRWLEGAAFGSGPTRAKAKALGRAGYIALWQGDPEAAKALHQGSLSLYRELKDEEGVASALAQIGFVAAFTRRDLEAMPALLEELWRLRPKIKDRSSIGRTLVAEGLMAGSLGDVERAEAAQEEALQTYREAGDTEGTVLSLTCLGLVVVGRADHGRAASLLRENLTLARELDYKVAIYYSLLGLASVAASRGQPARAARLWGAAEAMGEAFGILFLPLTGATVKYDRALAAASERLGEAAWEAAWAEGRAMGYERAVEYSLSEEPAPSCGAEQPAAGKPAGRLTRREEEVAILVARGLTNHQIASELSISEHTAATHVARILKKQGLRSRSQLSAWVTEQGRPPSDPG